MCIRVLFVVGKRRFLQSTTNGHQWTRIKENSHSCAFASIRGSVCVRIIRSHSSFARRKLRMRTSVSRTNLFGYIAPPLALSLAGRLRREVILMYRFFFVGAYQIGNFCRMNREWTPTDTNFSVVYICVHSWFEEHRTFGEPRIGANGRESWKLIRVHSGSFVV